MKQKAAHQNILYTVQEWIFYEDFQRVFSPCESYFYRHEEAVVEAKKMAEGRKIVVILRYTIDFNTTYKLGVLKAALEGKAQSFIVETERLEAWGRTPNGTIKRVNLRGARWKQWDGTVR